MTGESSACSAASRGQSSDEIRERSIGGREIVHEGDPDRPVARIDTSLIRATRDSLPGSTLIAASAQEPASRRVVVADLQPQKKTAIRSIVIRTVRASR